MIISTSGWKGKVIRQCINFLNPFASGEAIRATSNLSGSCQEYEMCTHGLIWFQLDFGIKALKAVKGPIFMLK